MRRFTTFVRDAGRLARLAVCVGAITLAEDALGLEIDRVHVDTDNEIIIVVGNEFDPGTSFTLGGVAVSTDSVTANQLHIPFSEAVASAVTDRGSYKLVADGTIALSVYFKAAVNVAPPPPPPPPPGGTTCPCMEGWSQSGIPLDNFTLCFRNQDGTQESISGARDSFFISAAFDPNNIFFDPVDPGKSVSYCALHDGVAWTVAEPVVNWDEYDDCEHWLWLNVCL